VSVFTPAQDAAIAKATDAYCQSARDLRIRVKAIELLDEVIDFNLETEIWCAAAREVMRRSSDRLGIAPKIPKRTRQARTHRVRI